MAVRRVVQVLAGGCAPEAGGVRLEARRALLGASRGTDGGGAEHRGHRQQQQPRQR
jgi:hypothetical protein